MHGRRRIVGIVTALSLAAALATSFIYQQTLTDYYKPPSIFSILPLPSEGIHSSNTGIPKNSPQCRTGAYYNPKPYNYVQSGWPMPFDYDDYGNMDCRSALYPLAYLIDVLFFGAFFAVATLVLRALKRRHMLTRRLVLGGAAVVVCAFTLTVCSERLGSVAVSPVPPPALSSISSDTPPWGVSYCPSFNAAVRAQCADTTSGLCEGMFPPDPRFVLFGWPVAYGYASFDTCGGEAFYPLIFIADIVCYAVGLGALGWVGFAVVSSLHDRHRFRVH